MRNLGIIFILLMSVSAFAQSFSYDADVTKDGEFFIKNEFSFESDIDVKKILVDYYLNETFQKTLDHMTHAQVIEETKVEEGYREIRLTATAKKKLAGVTFYNSIVFNCSEKDGFESFEFSCVLDTNKKTGKDSRDRFVYSEYSLSCEKSAGIVSCKFDLKGKAKRIRAFVYNRTEERLAIGGTQLYIKNLYKTFKALQNIDEEDKFKLKGDEFYKSDINTIRSRFFQSLDKKDRMSVESVNLNGELSL